MTDTRPVRDGEELPLAPLEAWLTERLPHLGRVTEVSQFPGGFSNLTYLLSCTHGEAVLRRPPRGVASGRAHDMLREAAILSVLELRGVPAPKALATCDDASVIGVHFYVMERVKGLILRGASAPSMFTPETLRALSERFVDTLVSIHGATPSDPVIGGLGKPMGYVARQVEGWTERWQKSRTDDVPAMEQLAAWLAEKQPSESGACLVHNDYKYDNLVLDPTQPDRIVAVLDWEMATLGPPECDVAWFVYLNRFLSEGVGAPALPGFPDEKETVALYEAAGGQKLADLHYYQVWAGLRFSVIFIRIIQRMEKQGVLVPGWSEQNNICTQFLAKVGGFAPPA
jgi:aminoglycoside phosphotransferase (APT) family kinase protein